MNGDAIQYNHSQRVIHNDLKPNNIVLEKRESSFQLIVIDFRKSLKVEVAASANKCLVEGKPAEISEKIPLRGTRISGWRLSELK